MERHIVNPPTGEEIIVPIRLNTSNTRLKKPPAWSWLAATVALLLVIALIGGGVWWIDYLSRHPASALVGPLPSEAVPAASPTAARAEPSAAGAALPSPTPAPPETPAAPMPAPDAAKTEAVEQLLAAAQRWAAAGSLSAAQADFQEALRLNPQSREARAGLQRVKSQMTEEEFRRWMEGGLAALNAGDAGAAQTRLLKARALRPEAPEVIEALAQAEGKLRSNRIEALRQKALADEQREDWTGALAVYEEVLALEPNLQFALQGKERSAALATLERRIGFFVNQPEVLGSDTQLNEAVRLLRDIQATPRIAPRLTAEAQKLKALVQTAQTPVQITIASDNLTEVSVYRVGKLGRFSARDLSLRPGTYILVGSRDGYRDERLEVDVKPGDEPIRVTLICRVKV